MVKRYRTEKFLMQYVIYDDGESYPLAAVINCKKSILGEHDIDGVGKAIKELYVSETRVDPNKVQTIVVSFSSLRVREK
ncbi:hypothetical protein [Listeria booriae]|uniref:hypothetical protein n=1 Tax=Listeria booriae TaxID=1552123 RepID=UPI00162AE1B7|nr:hypothetical protein [Listeria booriae]MBC2163433.1 hypothetical protein [Listeria booriae]